MIEAYITKLPYPVFANHNLLIYIYTGNVDIISQEIKEQSYLAEVI